MHLHDFKVAAPATVLGTYSTEPLCFPGHSLKERTAKLDKVTHIFMKIRILKPAHFFKTTNGLTSR